MPGARICLDTYQVIFFTHQVPLTLKNFFDFQFVHYSFHQLKMLGNYLTPFAKALAKILTRISQSYCDRYFMKDNIPLLTSISPLLVLHTDGPKMAGHKHLRILRIRT